ncbi:hypothetical protein [Pantoea agglomerans]|uniref:hypothetical protein n=1 Tax=Enterobacter agglomerans TaxID=549 RepID=UPI003D259126
MFKNALSFIALVGGIVLVIFLCRSQAQPLLEAAFTGDLPPTGWIILGYLGFIGTACALMLPVIVVVIVICLISSTADVSKRYMNLILRDVAALPCGR